MSYLGLEMVLFSIEMRGTRPRRWVVGPLAAALALHGLGLALAATFGFRVVVQAEETFDTFALSLRPAFEDGRGFAEEDEHEAGSSSEQELASKEEEDVLPEFLALEPLLETLIAEATTPTSEVPAELDPAQDASSLVAEENPAPLTEPALLTEVGAGAPALGVGAHPEGVPFALRARGASTWHSVLGDARAEHGLAAVGPRPGKGRAAAGAGPRTLVVRQPRPIETPSPSYPGLSRRAGEEGSVLCRLQIGLSGAVTTVEVLESSGFERLDQAARTTLLSWRFEPPEQEGRSVPATLLHRVTFRLEG